MYLYIYTYIYIYMFCPVHVYIQQLRCFERLSLYSALQTCSFSVAVSCQCRNICFRSSHGINHSSVGKVTKGTPISYTIKLLHAACQEAQIPARHTATLLAISIDRSLSLSLSISLFLSLSVYIYMHVCILHTCVCSYCCCMTNMRH